MTEKFHKAAKDGYVALLNQANRRDMNCADEDGMTPVHWAAFSGQLEALRVITGRGGDANKLDIWGHSSLHYAARKGHMTCVTFLTNFGTNLWSLDKDGQSAMDVAAMNGHEDVVRYLDAEMGRQIAQNPKEAEKKKRKAISDAEKRSKKWHKFASAETDKKIGHRNEIPSMCQDQPPFKPNPQLEMLPPGTKTTLRNLEQKFKQTLRIAKTTTGPIKSNPNHVTGRSFSQYVMTSSPPNAGGTIAATGGVIKKLTNRPTKNCKTRGSDSDIIYASGLEEATNESGISHCKSPDPPSLFERPGFGSVAFRSYQLTGTFGSFEKDTWSSTTGSDSSTRTSDQLMQLAWQPEDTEANPDDVTPLETFLNAIGLSEYFILFTREQISLDSLILLTNQDLIDLTIPMGPRRVLLDAINRRISLINQPGQLYDIRF